MQAQLPSDLLENKVDINQSVNRTNEATAADFKEIALLFRDHASLINLILDGKYSSKFMGFYGSLALIEATFTQSNEGDFAFIVDGSQSPTDIVIYQSGIWTIQDQSDQNLFYNQKIDFPETGASNKWYIATQEPAAYLWYNNIYNKVGKDGVNGLTAYEIATSHGYTGTEVEWLETLKGAVTNLPSAFLHVIVDHSESGTARDKLVAAANLLDNTVLQKGFQHWLYTTRFVSAYEDGFGVTGGDKFHIIIEKYLLLPTLIADGSNNISIGTSGTNLDAHHLLPFTPISSTELGSIVNDLGDIATDPINDAVNTTGPFNGYLPNPLIFKATQDNEEKLWLYVGNDAIIGTGETQTNLENYIPFPSDSASADPAPAQITIKVTDGVTGVESPLKLTFGDNFEVTQEADGSAKIDYKNTVDIDPEQVHANMAALYLDQSNQKEGEIHEVSDASGHSEITEGRAFFKYLGTTGASETDYTIFNFIENSLDSTSQTGTTIILSKSKDQYNHATPLGAGSYILEGDKIGDEADVVVNASTEPTFTHATLTVTKSATSLDFEVNTNMQAFFIINANGVRYFFVKY